MYDCVSRKVENLVGIKRTERSSFEVQLSAPTKIGHWA